MLLDSALRYTTVVVIFIIDNLTVPALVSLVQYFLFTRLVSQWLIELLAKMDQTFGTSGRRCRGSPLGG